MWLEVKKQPVTPVPAKPGQAPQPVTPPPSAPPAPQSPNTPPPPPLDLKAATSAYITAHTDYFPFSGCSGFEIDNARNQPVAEVSNAHCVFRTAPRIKGSDGRNYIVISSLDVDRGPGLNHLTKVGTIDQAIVPQQGDQSHDYAIFTLQGTTAADALAAVQANFLTPAEIATQANAPSQAPIVASGGYPQVQPTNTTGETQMVILWQKTVGMGSVFGTNGQSDPALMTAAGANAQTTVSSYGNSGAVSVEADTNNIGGSQQATFKLVGGDGGFDDFRPPNEGNTAGQDGQAVLQEREREFGVDLSAYANNPSTVDGPWGYATYWTSEDPSSDPNAETDQLVTSPSQIP